MTWMTSVPISDNNAEVTVLRHLDGCYSLAVRVPNDYLWEIPVVGHYSDRAEANTAIIADRKLRVET